MDHEFEDTGMYTVEEAAQSELGIISEFDRFYRGTIDLWREYIRLLRLRYGDYIKLEFGPGRQGKPPYVKRPWATIGLNASADPKSDIYRDLELGIPLPGGTIDEMYGNEFLEHIAGDRRILFMNDCYRVLKPGGFVVFNVPHWQSPYAGGDPTHKWPPFTEASFQYYCLRDDGTPFVDRFSDYGITCRFIFDGAPKITPGVSISVKLRKPNE